MCVVSEGTNLPIEISEGCRTEGFSEGFSVAEKQKFLTVILDL